MVLDRAWLVAEGKCLTSAVATLPPWWGVIEASGPATAPCLSTVREADRNPSIDPLALAQLLWRDEVLALLEARGAGHGVRSRPRDVLWTRLATMTPLDELRGLVRETLKRRDRSPIARPRTRRDATCLAGARFLGCLEAPLLEHSAQDTRLLG